VSIAKATIHVRSQRRENLEALRSLALSVETRIRDCRPSEAMRTWGGCVASDLNLWRMEMERELLEDGE
jgi:hypothetical protein